MASLSFNEKILSSKAIICDIEGTTTSISFVKETLFPYALKNVESFLKNTWNDEGTKSVIAEIRALAKKDLDAKREGTVPIVDDSAENEEQIKSVVKNVELQMSIDRKEWPLKALQALIWEQGYKDGELKGHVYEDVPKAFKSWIANGRKVYIYSSGTVNAQKLLFGNTEYGDLLEYLSDYFDTKTGPKFDKNSYIKIVEQLKCNVEEALFLTDIVKEAEAAIEAGLNVIILDRPGNAALSDDQKEKFTIIKNLTDIPFEQISGKRKIEETSAEQVQPNKIAKKEDTAAANVAEEVKEVSTNDKTDNCEKLIEKNGEEMDVDEIVTDETKIDIKKENGNEIEKKTEGKTLDDKKEETITELMDVDDTTNKTEKTLSKDEVDKAIVEEKYNDESEKDKLNESELDLTKKVASDGKAVVENSIPEVKITSPEEKKEIDMTENIPDTTENGKSDENVPDKIKETKEADIPIKKDTQIDSSEIVLKESNDKTEPSDVDSNKNSIKENHEKLSSAKLEKEIKLDSNVSSTEETIKIESEKPTNGQEKSETDDDKIVETSSKTDDIKDAEKKSSLENGISNTVKTDETKINEKSEILNKSEKPDTSKNTIEEITTKDTKNKEISSTEEINDTKVVVITKENDATNEVKISNKEENLNKTDDSKVVSNETTEVIKKSKEKVENGVDNVSSSSIENNVNEKAEVNGNDVSSSIDKQTCVENITEDKVVEKNGNSDSDKENDLDEQNTTATTTQQNSDEKDSTVTTTSSATLNTTAASATSSDIIVKKCVENVVAPIVPSSVEAES